MRELEMNWSKLTPDLKSKILLIMNDNILDTNFRTDIKGNTTTPTQSQTPPPVVFNQPSSPGISISSFGNTKNYTVIGGLLLLAIIIAAITLFVKPKTVSFGKFI
jgi:hypothetical protein